VADQRFLYLLRKYPQDRAGYAPWHRINPLSEDELRADIRIANDLREAYGMNTYEGAVGGGVIGGWLAQALRMRPDRLQVPAEPTRTLTPSL
jgi:hypothetical protein